MVQKGKGGGVWVGCRLKLAGGEARFDSWRVRLYNSSHGASG